MMKQEQNISEPWILSIHSPSPQLTMDRSTEEGVISGTNNEPATGAVFVLKLGSLTNEF